MKTQIKSKAEYLLEYFSDEDICHKDHEYEGKTVKDYLVDECVRFTVYRDLFPGGDMRKYIFKDGSSIITPVEHYAFYLGTSKDPHDFCYEGEDPTDY